MLPCPPRDARCCRLCFLQGQSFSLSSPSRTGTTVPHHPAADPRGLIFLFLVPPVAPLASTSSLLHPTCDHPFRPPSAPARPAPLGAGRWNHYGPLRSLGAPGVCARARRLMAVC